IGDKRAVRGQRVQNFFAKIARAGLVLFPRGQDVGQVIPSGQRSEVREIADKRSGQDRGEGVEKNRKDQGQRNYSRLAKQMLSAPLVPNYFEAEGERQSKDQIGLKVIMQIPNVSAAAGGINCREQKGRRAEQTQDHERRCASITPPQCVQADQANEAREWK